MPKIFEIHDLYGLATSAGLRQIIDDPAFKLSKTGQNWAKILVDADKLNELRYSPDANWSKQAATKSSRLPSGPKRRGDTVDSETAMRQVVQEVSFALTKYADKEGWKKDEYWIYYHVNSDWGVVNFVFVSRCFDGTDEWTSYQSVWRFLIEYFKDDPEILRYFTLVVRSKAKVDQGGLNSLGPSYREFWTFYPVPQP
jgi:hypothetical protein